LEYVALQFVEHKPGGQENTIGIAFNPDHNAGIDRGTLSRRP